MYRDKFFTPVKSLSIRCPQKANNLMGFTLIELLVVIAIIGLLSSIVLVSLQGAKDKADISKAQEFSHAVRVSLGTDLVGEWRFDEGTEIEAKDSSGYDNHGTLGNGLCTPGNGNCPTWTDGIFKEALGFDGAGDYVNCGNGGILNLKGQNEVTIESWIYSTGAGGTWHAIISKGTGQQYAVTLNRPSNYIHFETNQMSGGSCPALNTSLQTITSNSWHHIVAVFNGINKIIYINGERKALSNCSFNFADNTQNLEIGRDGDNEWFRGTIDEVRIYNKALSSAEIQQLYAQGAAEHGIVLK